MQIIIVFKRRLYCQSSSGHLVYKYRLSSVLLSWLELGLYRPVCLMWTHWTLKTQLYANAKFPTNHFLAVSLLVIFVTERSFQESTWPISFVFIFYVCAIHGYTVFEFFSYGCYCLFSYPILFHLCYLSGDTHLNIRSAKLILCWFMW